MQQSERKRGESAATTTHKREPKAPLPAQAPLHTTDETTQGFLSVLVTPKISFALPRRPHWRTPDDIGQEDLREAFLSRFPVRFDSAKLTFQCATPALELKAREDARLVYRIGCDGSGEEQVLLNILQQLDKVRHRSLATWA